MFHTNSAFHPSGVGKSSTSLGLRQGAFACVGWQVTLCDPIWQTTPCSSYTGFHKELNTALTLTRSGPRYGDLSDVINLSVG